MFLIKHGNTYITSYALAGVEKNGYDIRLRRMDCGNIVVKRLSFDADEIPKMEYIVECIADAIADMAAQEVVGALTPKNSRGWASVNIPVSTANDMILDIDEVIKMAEEEFDAGKEKNADE